MLFGFNQCAGNRRHWHHQSPKGHYIWSESLPMDVLISRFPDIRSLENNICGLKIAETWNTDKEWTAEYIINSSGLQPRSDIIREINHKAKQQLVWVNGALWWAWPSLRRGKLVSERSSTCTASEPCAPLPASLTRYMQDHFTETHTCPMTWFGCIQQLFQSNSFFYRSKVNKKEV